MEPENNTNPLPTGVQTMSPILNEREKANRIHKFAKRLSLFVFVIMFIFFGSATLFSGSSLVSLIWDVIICGIIAAPFYFAVMIFAPHKGTNEEQYAQSPVRLAAQIALLTGLGYFVELVYHAFSIADAQSALVFISGPFAGFGIAIGVFILVLPILFLLTKTPAHTLLSNRINRVLIITIICTIILLIIANTPAFFNW